MKTTCSLCRKFVDCCYAHWIEKDGARVGMLVCEDCITRYRSRLEVLGRDFLFAVRPGSSQGTDRK